MRGRACHLSASPPLFCLPANPQQRKRVARFNSKMIAVLFPSSPPSGSVHDDVCVSLALYWPSPPRSLFSRFVCLPCGPDRCPTSPQINTLSELVFSVFFCLTKLCLNEYPPAVLVPMPACLFPLPQPKQVSRPIPVYRFALDPSRPRFDEQGTFGQNPGNFSVALTFLLLQAPLTRSHEAAGQLNGDSTSYS